MCPLPLANAICLGKKYPILIDSNAAQNHIQGPVTKHPAKFWDYKTQYKILDLSTELIR